MNLSLFISKTQNLSLFISKMQSVHFRTQLQKITALRVSAEGRVKWSG